MTIKTDKSNHPRKSRPAAGKRRLVAREAAEMPARGPAETRAIQYITDMLAGRK